MCVQPRTRSRTRTSTEKAVSLYNFTGGLVACNSELRCMQPNQPNAILTIVLTHFVSLNDNKLTIVKNLTILLL